MKKPGLRRSALFAGSAAAMLATGFTAVAIASNVGMASAATDDGPPSICFADRPGAKALAVATPAPSANSAIVTVSVTVDPTVRIHLDSAGKVVKVGTNSGCAPRVGDQFATEADNGQVTSADGAAIKQVLENCDWHGSWDDTTKLHNCHS